MPIPRLLQLILITFGVTMGLALTGCPGDDDDSGTDETELCSGPGCLNADECPTETVTAGDACDFNGNCHYCADGDDTAAAGFTCDGTSFTDQGTYDCTQ